MTPVLAAVGGFIPVLVIVLIIISILVARSRREDPEEGQQTSAVVLEVHAERRNVGPTGLVGYQALVRFATSNGLTIETWAPTALPPKKWQVPGQHVVVSYSPENPSRARVQRVL